MLAPSKALPGMDPETVLQQNPANRQIAGTRQPHLVFRMDLGNCIYDPQRRQLLIGSGNRILHTENLQTPEHATGDYLDLYCGQERSLIIARNSIIVMPGTRMIREGNSILPGPHSGLASFAIMTREHIRADPVAFTTGEEGRYAFVIGQNGIVAGADTTGNEMIVFDSSRHFEHSIDDNHLPVLFFHEDFLYIFQPGSSSIAEIGIDMEHGQISRGSYPTSIPAPEDAEIEVVGNSVRFDFGPRIISIIQGVRADEIAD